MKRRSFFKNLSSSIAAIALASAVEVFGAADRVKTLVPKINPAWTTAYFDGLLAFHPDIDEILKQNIELSVRRYAWDGSDFVEIPRFILVADDTI